MSRRVGDLLVNIIQPMLGASIPQVVKTTGRKTSPSWFRTAW